MKKKSRQLYPDSYFGARVKIILVIQEFIYLQYDVQVKMKLILPQFVFHAFHIEGISQGNLY